MNCVVPPLMKMSGLINILKLAYFSKILYYSKFLLADL